MFIQTAWIVECLVTLNTCIHNFFWVFSNASLEEGNNQFAHCTDKSNLFSVSLHMLIHIEQMKIELNNTCISQTGLNFDTYKLVEANIHPTLHFRRNGFWRQMAVVFLKHSFDLKTPKILSFFKIRYLSLNPRISSQDIRFLRCLKHGLTLGLKFHAYCG